MIWYIYGASNGGVGRGGGWGEGWGIYSAITQPSLEGVGEEVYQRETGKETGVGEEFGSMGMSICAPLIFSGQKRNNWR